MNKLLKLLVVVGLTAGFSTAMAEEKQREGFEAGIGIGKFFYDNDVLLDGDVSMGVLNLGYQFNNNWQLDLMYGNPDTRYIPNGREVDVDWFAVRGMYLFDVGMDHTPYLSAGFDALDVFSGEQDLVVGVGVKAITDGNLVLRLEGNYHAGEGDTSVLAMLGYHFGEKSMVMDEPGDGDMDGVPDNIDVCPKTAPGTKVDERGCMIMEKDTDGDGVLDSADKCPNTPAGALVDAMGCQKELEKEVSVELQINFANDSDEVTANYNSELQRVAEFMRAYAGTQVVIEGHTDSVGRASYNQGLSERRANSVASALSARFGIAADRISAVGYGESKPVESNDTAEGRQANRRVVAVINERVKEKQWQQ